jgi:hypothetical protein
MIFDRLSKFLAASGRLKDKTTFALALAAAPIASPRGRWV